MEDIFEKRLHVLRDAYKVLVSKKNEPRNEVGNGIFSRYENPVLTAAHAPVFWKYDLNKQTNPFLMERFGINAVFNAGAIRFNNEYVVVARVEGADRKSFFAVAKSPNGIDQFQFDTFPILLDEANAPDVNVYDMRLTEHEDGWIYGVFCTERKDPAAKPGNESDAVAQCGIIRTKDLKEWQRLADLKTPSAQQRNVVLHPEFVDGKYAFYTRPQDSFIEAGSGGGIGLGLAANIENAIIEKELIVQRKQYHTVYEVKNGQGPAPIKTEKGWLHMAHGVRNTAAGLRYVLYMFMTSLGDIAKVIYEPAGYFMAPEGEERIGDVSNVVFSNGWIKDDDGKIFIYYGSSDTRLHVATSTVAQLLDYVINTSKDKLRSRKSVETLHEIIHKNLGIEVLA